MTRLQARRSGRVLAVALLMGLGSAASLQAAEAAPVAAGLEAAAAPPAVSYEVEALGEGAELRVVASLPAGTSRLVLADGFLGFVTDLSADDGRGSRAVAVSGDAVELPACARSACRLEYRFRLGEAARGGRRRSGAVEHAGALLAPPSAWLLRPEPANQGTRFTLQVRTSGGIRFVCGLPLLEDGPSPAYGGTLAALDEAPYAGLGRFEIQRMDVDGSSLELAIAPGERTLSGEALAGWLRRSARGVADYVGRFPVPRALVIVLPGAGGRPVGYGSTMGNGGASIMVSLGAACSEAELRADWVLVHELLHLALPNLPRRHRWVEEGLSTYVEPVIRARLGLISPEERWAELVRKLPRGQPRPQDRGLDLTASWGSTYWGGALFWLLADLEIRERSANRLGLEDALRGIVSAGGNIQVSWELERLLRAGDAATGFDVLQGLHARMGDSPWGVDLDQLWGRLGVVPDVGGVRLERGAPLAAIRDAILAPAADRPGAGRGGRR